MFGLDQYAGDVLLAYGLGLALLIGVIVQSIWRAKAVKVQLDEIEND